MRIALIHALKHSPPPIEAAFKALWPQPQLMNLLDDSLSADLARDGHLSEAMTARFITLARYCIDQGASGILFTCSAFGPCIDAVKQAFLQIPVLKPNEAMIEDAVRQGTRIGLLSTFAPTLASMPSEFPASITLHPRLIKGGLAALDRGDGSEHDRLAALAAKDLQGCDAIALAQFSLARAADAVAQSSGLPVLTTPESAVRKLKALLA
jgi:aspartate/glutamate racemase